MEDEKTTEEKLKRIASLYEKIGKKEQQKTRPKGMGKLYRELQDLLSELKPKIELVDASRFKLETEDGFSLTGRINNKGNPTSIGVSDKDKELANAIKTIVKMTIN